MGDPFSHRLRAEDIAGADKKCAVIATQCAKHYLKVLLGDDYRADQNWRSDSKFNAYPGSPDSGEYLKRCQEAFTEVGYETDMLLSKDAFDVRIANLARRNEGQVKEKLQDIAALQLYRHMKDPMPNTFMKRDIADAALIERLHELATPLLMRHKDGPDIEGRLFVDAHEQLERFNIPASFLGK